MRYNTEGATNQHEALYDLLLNVIIEVLKHYVIILSSRMNIYFYCRAARIPVWHIRQ